MEETITYKDISTLFCPTCNKPRDELIDLVGDGFAVLRCFNCDTALAYGIFVGFRAICLECGCLVTVS